MNLLLSSYTCGFCVTDMLEDVGEISEILGRSYGCPDGVEEEDLDAELACLEDELATEEFDFAAADSVPAAGQAEKDSYLHSLPSQPTAAPSVFSQAEASAASAAPASAAQYNALA